MRKRLPLPVMVTLLGVLLAAVLIAGGLVWDQHRGYRPVDDSAPLPPRPAPTGPFTHAMTVIGDSYGQGVGPGGRTWWQQVAVRHGLIPKGAPVGSTGYCALGDRGFRAQVPGVLKYNSALIVVAGSRNDYSCSLDETRSAALDILGRLHAGAPAAKIVVVGPLWGSDTPAPSVRQANEATRQAAEQLGMPFVDALGSAWFEGHPELIKSDHAHPIPKGVDVLANHLDDALTGVGAFS